MLDQLLLDVHVNTQKTYECKGLKVVSVIFIRIPKCLKSKAHVFIQILNDRIQLRFLHTADPLINIRESDTSIFPLKKFFRQRADERLNIADREKIFHIIDEDKKKQMLIRIFFSDRRRNQVILCIIIDHRLCQNLIIRITLA